MAQSPGGVDDSTNGVKAPCSTSLRIVSYFLKMVEYLDEYLLKSNLLYQTLCRPWQGCHFQADQECHFDLSAPYLIFNQDRERRQRFLHHWVRYQ